MGRNARVLYRDPVSRIFFARWYDMDGIKIRLSLNTANETEAINRLPIVMSSKMSWNQYQKSLKGMNTLVVNAIDQHKIIPGLALPAQSEALSTLISSATSAGQANFDSDRSFWIINALATGLPTDTTAMFTPASSLPSSNGLLEGLNILKATAIIDNWTEIENFYSITMEQVFIDKSRVKRVASMWLSFLQNNNIKSWNQITEELMIQFKKYRKTVTIPRGKNSKVKGKPCSNATLNRDIQYLEKSFSEAIARGYMQINPIRNWKPEVHTVPTKNTLTLDEIKKIFDHLTVQIRNMAILLFCSCKRRKEITSLQIEDVNFSGHYICYTEYKNSSRLKCIRKAFYLTPAMELFLKRIIGDRKSGSLWPDNHHPDFFSHAFEEIASKVVPHKHSTLKDMRQVATDVMEKAGLSDNEIDITLGHLSVSKALQYYQDRSPDAIARRLSVRTKPGIEVLSAAIAEYLK